MPSASLQCWRSDRCTALDEIEDAHQEIGGSGRGRRYATQQLNYAYALLLASQFQGFCRDLHDECAVFIVQDVTPAPRKEAFRDALLRYRKLDHGNPNPGNLGADFEVFGLSFWREVQSLDGRNERRQALLERLCERRNSIAHCDFSKFPEREKLQLQEVRAWRAACNQLATAFDEAMRHHLEKMMGTSPWNAGSS